MSLLHVWDMDGTLLRGTTASLQIAGRLGCVEEMLELEEAFIREALDTRGFAAALCSLWSGLTSSVVQDAFDGSPWMTGMREVFDDIRRRGERSVVMTMSPDFFAQLLLATGADEVVASRFPVLPLYGQADPDGILTPESKVVAVDRIRAVHGYGRDQCVAYGDSGSDIPLFRELQHTVAINAGEPLRRLARLTYEGEDLRDAYQMARNGFPLPEPTG